MPDQSEEVGEGTAMLINILHQNWNKMHQLHCFLSPKAQKQPEPDETLEDAITRMPRVVSMQQFDSSILRHLFEKNIWHHMAPMAFSV